MKKRFIFCILILFTLFLYACDTNKIYSIIYIDGNEVMSLSPETYVSGEEIKLPTPTKDYYNFIGWFDNKNFEGDTVTSISKTDKDNKIFYACFEKFKEQDLVEKLNLSKQEFEVEIDTEIVNILNDIKITVDYLDGTKKDLTLNDCTLDLEYNASLPGTYHGSISYLGFSQAIIITVLEEENPIVDASEAINLYSYETEYTTGLTSTGGKVLVVPVSFINYDYTNEMIETLNKAFFGTGEDTGWESLASYYSKSSFGKCKIEGTVLPTYNTGKKYSYYNNLEKKSNNGMETLMKEVLEYYDDSIDYSEYDTNDDGYIDAIYLMYSCPYSYKDDTIFWAITTEYFTEDYEYYDNVEADFYSLISYDFFEDNLENNKKIKINTETIIHETGHIFGLNDYYDYDETVGDDGGIGGSDMMDCNVGDHNAYSKALLGWINPTVLDISLLKKEYTINLSSYSETGQALIIANQWNNTYLDEYYIIDFYTPTSLYALEAGANGIFTTQGIRIYHVESETVTSTDDNIWYIYKYNNSNTTYKQIELIEADGKEDISLYNDYSSNSDLFTKGDNFTTNTWYSKDKITFNISVIDITSGSATIKISID